MTRTTLSKKGALLVYLVYALFATLVAAETIGMLMVTTDVFAKGLKINLELDSAESGNSAITTYQYNHIVASPSSFYVNQGRTPIELQYIDDQVQTGQFQICVRLDNGNQGCGNGYNSPEKHPENVFVSIQGGGGSQPVFEQQQ